CSPSPSLRSPPLPSPPSCLPLTPPAPPAAPPLPFHAALPLYPAVVSRSSWPRPSSAGCFSIQPRRSIRAALRLKLDCSSSSSPRSEEHTSELQSLTNLVCRLLLEKKKKHTPATDHYTTPASAH